MIPTLLLIHSFFDYPLRTGAMMGTMAFACAVLITPQLPAEAKEKHDLRRLNERLSRPRSSVLASTPSRVQASTSALGKPSVATLQSPSPQTKSEPSTPPTHQRWDADIEWPKEWSQSAKDQGREKKDS